MMVVVPLHVGIYKVQNDLRLITTFHRIGQIENPFEDCFCVPCRGRSSEGKFSTFPSIPGTEMGTIGRRRCLIQLREGNKCAEILDESKSVIHIKFSPEKEGKNAFGQKRQEAPANGALSCCRLLGLSS